MWEFTQDPVICDIKIGIEIEIEIPQITDIDVVYEGLDYGNSYFRLMNEHSLEHGVEFISRKPSEVLYPNNPITLKEAPKFFNQYLSTIRKLPAVVESERTSTHIHIESGIAKRETTNFYRNLLVVENALLSMYGQGRENNQYCTPISPFKTRVELRGNNNLYGCSGALRQRKYKAVARRDDIGTIEVRLARMMTDPKIFSEYLGILMEIKRDSEEDISYVENVDKITERFPEKYKAIIENKACLLAVWS